MKNGGSAKVIIVAVNPAKSALSPLYCATPSYNPLFPSAHSTKMLGGPVEWSSNAFVMLWDAHGTSEWPVSPVPSWQHLHWKGVFMALTWQSAFPNSTTQEEQRWLQREEEGRLHSILNYEGVLPSVKHHAHIRGRNTPLHSPLHTLPKSLIMQNLLTCVICFVG